MGVDVDVDVDGAAGVAYEREGSHESFGQIGDSWWSGPQYYCRM